MTFENLWEADSATYAEEVKSFWERHNLLDTSINPDERAKQVVFKVTSEQDGIAGLSTAFKVRIPQIKHYFFAVRCVLSPDARIPGLLSKLLVETRDFLESLYLKGVEKECIGITTLVENEDLKKHRREAVWPASEMAFVGKSPKGHHIRVYYFKGAKI